MLLLQFLLPVSYNAFVAAQCKAQRLLVPPLNRLLDVGLIRTGLEQIVEFIFVAHLDLHDPPVLIRALIYLKAQI
jgi:hypothetical protein